MKIKTDASQGNFTTGATALSRRVPGGHGRSLGCRRGVRPPSSLVCVPWVDDDQHHATPLGNSRGASFAGFGVGSARGPAAHRWDHQRNRAAARQVGRTQEARADRAGRPAPAPTHSDFGPQKTFLLDFREPRSMRLL